MVVVTLARPKMALRAVVLAMLVTIVTGVPLSLGLSFGYALVAFVAGAITFAVSSVLGDQRCTGLS